MVEKSTIYIEQSIKEKKKKEKVIYYIYSFWEKV